MTITSETFQLVAHTLAGIRADLRPDPEGDIEFTINEVQERLALAFQEVNPAFNQTVFNAACRR